jgi:bifunctional DNA-binding transcriptional regulator/antitoxin component of YhaV-PrlF toxin-antitoxin module
MEKNVTEHPIVSAIVDENGQIVISEDSKSLGLRPGQKLKLLVVFPGNYEVEAKEEPTEGAKLLAELQAEGLIGFAGFRSSDFASRLREAAWEGGDKLQELIKEQE